jgi:hypothetical protein
MAACRRLYTIHNLESGDVIMTTITRSVCAVLLYLLSTEIAAAQANVRCSPVSSTITTQTVRCVGGITIIAENGARYTLSDTNRDGRIDSVELGGKALLLDVPGMPGDKKFKVTTPQAIAAVRGTKWAVDVTEDKTSVFVVNGRVLVGRRLSAGKQNVVLRDGEGVDVEATGPLTVKRWAPARVAALMARLGQ